MTEQKKLPEVCHVPGCGTATIDGTVHCHVHRPVAMKLAGEDGNAFAILGRFQRYARKAGWDRDGINAAIGEAKSGDYDNLLRTMLRYCEEPPAEEWED